MKTSILVLGLAMAHSSLADGLPKDEQDRLAVPHTLVTLSPSQVEEMEALDSVTLTREQWAGLRKVSPNTPKRIEGQKARLGGGVGHGRRRSAKPDLLPDQRAPRHLARAAFDDLGLV